MATSTKDKKTNKSNKAASNGRAHKDGLRKPQVRILAALKKANKALTRADIAAKAPVDVAACVEYLGSPDAATRKANDTKHFPSLTTLGYTSLKTNDEGAATYAITASGKAALAKAL